MGEPHTPRATAWACHSLMRSSVAWGGFAGSRVVFGGFATSSLVFCFRLTSVEAPLVGCREVRRPKTECQSENKKHGLSPRSALAWIASVCRLPGSGLQVTMTYRFLCCRFRLGNRRGVDAIVNGLRITSRSSRRGLRQAELAGLLAVEREPGSKLIVSVLEFRGSERWPLYGPIPRTWWLLDSRLLRESLQVASVCSLLAG
jgi:hypothetical protein